MKADDAILAGPQHNELIEYCFKHYENELKLIAGGAIQNTIRTAQWVFDFYSLRQTLFLGSVGEDQYATMLEEQAKKDNVEPLYCKIKKVIEDTNNQNEICKQPKEKTDLDERVGALNGEQAKDDQQVEKGRLDSTKTGICLALNTNNGLYRSMLAFLGAARQLNLSHIDDYLDKVARSTLVYCGGFLLPTSFAVADKLAQFCLENDKKFAFNLSAPYICSNFGNLVAQLIPSLDLIFGNEKELREFANYHYFKVST